MLQRKRIGEILLDRGAVGRKELEAALAHQRNKGGRLGEILVDQKAAQAVDIASALAEQQDLGFLLQVDVDRVQLDLLQHLPLGYARSRQVLVMHREGDTLHAVMADPLDIVAIDNIARVYGCEVEPYVASPQAVADAINVAYDRFDRLHGSYGEMLDDDEAPVQEVGEPELESAVDLLGAGGDDEAPVIQFVNTTFVRAARDQASDIHIEPFESRIQVRFRIDGVLQRVAEVPKRFHGSVVARIKIMASLDIAEKRLPQDGRIRIRLAGRDIDIRVATSPTAHGERVTMRLLDKSAVLLDLSAIGMDDRTLGQVEDLIARPYGILLVTGPTGSGKTTTLYSCLARINSPDRNILTVEDPVEFQLEGISQMAVNPKIHLNFATGLRSYLRHDPDVIMVGEIRDQETAEIAIQASLTGHLVFSTLHTNDAAGAFTRLIDMGVEPFLVASSLLGNMAQRLVRKLCRSCRIPYEPTDAELDKLEIQRSELEAAGGVLYRAQGCDECRHRGYRGRTGIYELLTVTEDIRHLVMQRADAGSIKKVAVAEGMRTLRRDGADKVLRGETTLEEILRVTQREVA